MITFCAVCTGPIGRAVFAERLLKLNGACLAVIACPIPPTAAAGIAGDEEAMALKAALDNGDTSLHFTLGRAIFSEHWRVTGLPIGLGCGAGPAPGIGFIDFVIAIVI
jgi:hypothetical protein